MHNISLLTQPLPPHFLQMRVEVLEGQGMHSIFLGEVQCSDELAFFH